MPEWRARAQALGLVRESMALSPPRPFDPLTGERVRLPRVPAPDLPPNEIRSLKRAPALPRLPRDGVAEGAGARPTGAGFRAPAELSPERELGVLEAVARAVAHVAERRTTIPEAEIRAVALGHAPGRYTLAEVDAAIARLASGGELIEAERRGMDRAFVTDRAVRTERRVLASMRAGRGKRSALAGADVVEARLEASRLTRGQREAVRTVLLSNDLVIGVQGHAGSGKTTMLSEVKELLGERRIQGLAPSAAAARVLAREAGCCSACNFDLQYQATSIAYRADRRATQAPNNKHQAVVLVTLAEEVDEILAPDLVGPEAVRRGVVFQVPGERLEDQGDRGQALLAVIDQTGRPVGVEGIDGGDVHDGSEEVLAHVLTLAGVEDVVPELAAMPPRPGVSALVDGDAKLRRLPDEVEEEGFRGAHGMLRIGGTRPGPTPGYPGPHPTQRFTRLLAM